MQHSNGRPHSINTQALYKRLKTNDTLTAIWGPALEAQRQFVNKGGGLSPVDIYWTMHVSWLDDYGPWRMMSRPSRLPAGQRAEWGAVDSRSGEEHLSDIFAAAGARKSYDDKARRTNMFVRPRSGPSARRSIPATGVGNS